MITVTPGTKKYLTNGFIYVEGSVYLPTSGDASAWYEVDTIETENVLTPDEAARMLFNGTEDIKETAVTEMQKNLNLIQLLGGISIEVVQSDKVGFNWHNYYVGETLVKQEYVEQENPVGTESNPFEYVEGMQLVNNAYYKKDGKIYVWMDEWVEWTTE